MIGPAIIHIGLGSTGEAIVRTIVKGPMAGRLRWVDERAHLPLRYARSRSDAPSFSFIRNPFDWYLSTYMVQASKHRWRGPFEDWFYNRRDTRAETAYPGPGICMWDSWLYMTEVVPGEGCAVDYVGQFEDMLNGLVYIFSEVVPGVVSEDELRDNFPACAGRSSTTGPWMRGIEQWMRDEMYTPAMIEHIYRQDAPIFERFGYTFEEKYYFQGGLPPSVHKGVGGIGWAEEKHLTDQWRTEWELPGKW